GNVSVIRRDRLYREDGKVNSAVVARDDFVGDVGELLESIQQAIHDEAQDRMAANIDRSITDFAGIEAFFANGGKYPGWVEVQWAKPTGAALDAVDERLKKLKLTIRNAPMGAAPADGACVFTGEPAVERILIGRAY
ncbi:MAG TPA: proline--tRNA ligase, partial [Sphingomonas sp.]|nr:proline--tRNA ligase [Sphingomonas sp.]